MQKDLSDFQKAFLAKGTQSTLFTQKEFDDALAFAKAEIMAMAIEASKTAVRRYSHQAAHPRLYYSLFSRHWPQVPQWHG